MKRLFQEFFRSLPMAARVFVLIFALGYPVAQLGVRCHWFNLYAWTGLAPALFWKGQVWRAFTYAFMPGCIADWLCSLFWLATLVALVNRHWTGRGFWAYCLLGALGGALLPILTKAGIVIFGPDAMLFALLVAWERLHRHERILLLAIGEMSVRQAAILIAIVDSIVVFVLSGWFVLLSMWCGGVAGWIYFAVREARLLRRGAQTTNSERIARLEL